MPRRILPLPRLTNTNTNIDINTIIDIRTDITIDH